jgi:hypothetical protein
VSWNDWITKTLLSCSLQIGDGETLVNNVPTKRNVEDDDSQQEDFNCCSRNTLRIQTAVYSFLKTHVYSILSVTLDCPFWLPLRYSLTFILYCVLYIVSYFGLSFLIAPSVFSNVYFILCTLYCQLLWIVLFDCPFGIL